MHRSLTLPGALACLAFALAAVLPFEPWGQSRLSPCSFEVRVESDASGLVQLYYDVGRGMSEADSAIQPIIAGHPGLLRFSLPYGTFRTLRFDPLDRETHMRISGARVVDGSGRTLVAFAPDQFLPQYQIDMLRPEGAALAIETTPGGFDPQLGIRLAGPFTLARPFWWRDSLAVFAVMIGLLLLAGWAGRSSRVRLGSARGRPGPRPAAPPGGR